MNPDAEDRLLEAARRLFAEKGFDGTGVAEIAKEAGVAKSLFFHYFRTKEAVLQRIYQDFFRDSEAVQSQSFPASHDAPSQDTEAFTRIMLDFLRRNEPVLRILMRENMGNSGGPSVFGVFQGSYETWKSWYSERGFPPLAEPDGHIFVFFFTLLPCLSFVLFDEAFAQHFGLDKSQLEARFVAFLSYSTRVLAQKLLSPPSKT